MNENRSIKDVVTEYINLMLSKSVANYRLIKIVYPDFSYLFMTPEYILRNEFLNKHFYVYNHFYNTDDRLIIYVDEDDY